MCPHEPRSREFTKAEDMSGDPSLLDVPSFLLRRKSARLNVLNLNPIHRVCSGTFPSRPYRFPPKFHRRDTQ